MRQPDTTVHARLTRTASTCAPLTSGIPREMHFYIHIVSARSQTSHKFAPNWPEELMTADFEIAPVLPFTLTSVRSVFALPLDAVA